MYHIIAVVVVEAENTDLVLTIRSGHLKMFQIAFNDFQDSMH